MALAWNAGWVNALRGSNPLSSAREAPVTCHGGFLLLGGWFTRLPWFAPTPFALTPFAPTPFAPTPFASMDPCTGQTYAVVHSRSSRFRVDVTLTRPDVCSGPLTRNGGHRTIEPTNHHPSCTTLQ